MQIILTYHYNSLYDIYTYIYTHLFILFPFHPGLVFGKKNQNPFSQPRLKSTLLVDPEKGLAVVVAVALVGPTAAVVVVDTVCHGSACGFFTGIF